MSDSAGVCTFVRVDVVERDNVTEPTVTSSYRLRLTDQQT